MSIKRKFFSIITLSFAVVAFSTFVSAQDGSGQTDTPQKKEGRYGKGMRGEGHRGGKGMRGGNIMRSLRGIELTEAQETQIKSLMDAQKATYEPKREEMRSLMMKKCDGSITEDEKARFDQFRNEMKASSQQLELSVMALLTPEQTAKLTQMKAEREQRMQEHKQKRMERKQQTEKPTDN